MSTFKYEKLQSGFGRMSRAIAFKHGCAAANTLTFFIDKMDQNKGKPFSASIKYIMNGTLQKEDRVKESIKKLKELKLITVKTTHGKPNIYKPNVEAIFLVEKAASIEAKLFIKDNLDEAKKKKDDVDKFFKDKEDKAVEELKRTLNLMEEIEESGGGKTPTNPGEKPLPNEGKNPSNDYSLKDNSFKDNSFNNKGTEDEEMPAALVVVGDNFSRTEREVEQVKEVVDECIERIRYQNKNNDMGVMIHDKVVAKLYGMPKLLITGRFVGMVNIFNGFDLRAHITNSIKSNTKAMLSTAIKQMEEMIEDGRYERWVKRFAEYDSNDGKEEEEEEYMDELIELDELEDLDSI